MHAMSGYSRAGPGSLIRIACPLLDDMSSLYDELVLLLMVSVLVGPEGFSSVSTLDHTNCR